LSEGVSVTEACFASGYQNLSHFTRQFRRGYGVMPSIYATQFSIRFVQGRNSKKVQATFTNTEAQCSLVGNMKSNLLRGTALGLASFTILPVNGLAQDQYREVLRAQDTVWRAWFANDQATLEKVLPEKVIAINNGQDRWEHRAQILESAKRFAADGDKLIRLSFPHVEAQFFDDVAILYSHWETETEVHGKPVVSSGRATEIFVHRNGKWLNAGWHLDSGR
jgi:AraC-like DNA-binding protein